MKAAFEAACAGLAKGRVPFSREELARAVIALAKAGEFAPENLPIGARGSHAPEQAPILK